MSSHIGRWSLGVIIALHLGISIGVFATKWLTRAPDSRVCISLEELRRTPRLEWQQ